MVTPSPAQALSNLLRFGHIAEIAGITCRVQSGGLLTDFIGCFAPCAGEHSTWIPLSIGEQVLLLCPDGDTANAVALRGLASEAYPSPSDQPTLWVQRFPDGAQVRYDSAAHALHATLPDGGSAELTASAGITLHGPLTVNGPVIFNGETTCTGSITAEGDVSAAGISLTQHVHGQVQPGPGQTGAPA